MTAMMRALTVLAFGLLAATSGAEAQMPDVSQMSGIPLPTTDLPSGSVSVRVIRGALTNNLAGQPVELHVGAEVRSVTTDSEGRATFTDLRSGVTVHATTTVDGERLTSQEFPVPVTGGVRLILVARPLAADDRTPRPPETGNPLVPPGAVSLGDQSRFLVEISDDGIDVYLLLEVVNPSRTPLELTAPLTFEAPPEASGATLLTGSSPQATAEGNRVLVSGSLAPGPTAVQLAYRVPYGDSRVTIRQSLPATISQISLLVRKVGNLTFYSPQIGDSRETVLDGRTYYVASGPAIPAGGVLELQLEGLPYHSSLPRYVTLALAVLILGSGVWLSTGEPERAVPRSRRALEDRRERLFAELEALEGAPGSGRAAGSHHQVEREKLIAELEDIYAWLDSLGPATASTGRRQEAVAVEASLRRA